MTADSHDERIEVITSREGLVPLAAEWNELARLRENPLLCHEWFMACARAFEAGNALRVVVARSRDGIGAIAPLAVSKFRGHRRLVILGAEEQFEPCELLYRDERSLRRALAAALGLGLPIILRRIPAESPVPRIISDIAGSRALTFLRDGGASPQLKIGCTWDDFVAGMAARRRSDLRRAQRRAEKIGPVSFSVSKVRSDTVDAALALFYRLEASGWKGQTGGALLMQPRYRRFTDDYYRANAASGIVRTAVLTVGDDPAAALLGVEFADRFWLQKIAYDPAFSHCSPGILLTHEILRHAFESGLTGFEFLGLEEPWMRMWTKQVRACVSHAIYPLSPRGVSSLGADVLAHGVRTISGKLQRARASG